MVYRPDLYLILVSTRFNKKQLFEHDTYALYNDNALDPDEKLILLIVISITCYIYQIIRPILCVSIRMSSIKQASFSWFSGLN